LSADKPLRILQVIPSIGQERGGPIQVVKEMCRALADRGHAVELHATDAGPRGARLPPDARDLDLGPGVTLHLHRADLLVPPYASTAMLFALVQAIRRADLAHVHTCFNAPASTAMWLLRRMGRIPYVLRTCGMLDAYSLAQHPLRKRLWLAGLERANVLAASTVQVSTPLEEREVRHAIRAARTLVLPQGVAPPSPPSDARPHARPYLLFLSRVAVKKGLLRLVSAFAQLLERLRVKGHPLSDTLDLVIAGPDEYGHRAEVEAHIAQLGRNPQNRDLRGRIAFVGPVSGASKSAWFAHAEAFVLPSDDENFGVVVVEAAHLGTPVLVSDAVGLADAVARHGAGLVLPRTVEAWADGLEAVLARGREPFRSGTMALAGDFGWPELARRLEGRYREILAQNVP
jgi:glycosyltransferase involved in cell wall biosynthesis